MDKRKPKRGEGGGADSGAVEPFAIGASTISAGNGRASEALRDLKEICSALKKLKDYPIQVAANERIPAGYPMGIKVDGIIYFGTWKYSEFMEALSSGEPKQAIAWLSAQKIIDCGDPFSIVANPFKGPYKG